MLSVEEVGQAKGWLSGARSANSQLRSANDELRQLVEEAQKLRELEKQLREAPDSETAKRDKKLLRERKRALQKKTEQHAAKPVCVVSCPEPLAAALSKAAVVEESSVQNKVAFAETWKAAPRAPKASVPGLTLQQLPLQIVHSPAGRPAAIETAQSDQQTVTHSPTQTNPASASSRSFYRRHLLPTCGHTYWKGLHSHFRQERLHEHPTPVVVRTPCGTKEHYIEHMLRQCGQDCWERLHSSVRQAKQHQQPAVLTCVASDYYCQHLLRQCSRDCWERLCHPVQVRQDGRGQGGELVATEVAASPNMQTHPATASSHSFYKRHMLPAGGQDEVEGLKSHVRQASQESMVPAAEASGGGREYYCEHLLRQCGQDCWERLHSRLRQAGRPQQSPGPACAAREYYCEHLLRQCSTDCWEKLHEQVRQLPLPEGGDRSWVALAHPVQTDPGSTSLLSFYRRHVLPSCGHDCWQRLHSQVRPLKQERSAPAAVQTPWDAQEYYRDHLLRQCGGDSWERLHSSVRQARQPQHQTPAALALALDIADIEGYYSKHLLRQCSRDCWERLHCRVQHSQEAHVGQVRVTDMAASAQAQSRQSPLMTASPRSFYRRHVLPSCGHDHLQRLHSHFWRAGQDRLALAAAQPTFAASEYYCEHVLRQCGQDCWERLHTSVRQAGQQQRPLGQTWATREYYCEHLLRQCSRDLWERLQCRLQVKQEAQVDQLPSEAVQSSVQTDLATASPPSFYFRHVLPSCGQDYWQRLHSQVQQARQESCALMATSAAEPCSVTEAGQLQQPLVEQFAAGEYYCEHLLRQCSMDFWEKLQCRLQTRSEAEGEPLLAAAMKPPQSDLVKSSPRSFYCRHLLPTCGRDHWQRLHSQVSQAQLESAVPAVTTTVLGASEPLAEQYYCQHLLRQCSHDCWERLHSSVRQARQSQQPAASRFAASEYYCQHLLRQCSLDCWETLHCRMQDGQRHEAQTFQSPAEERDLCILQRDLAATSPRSFYRRHLLPMCGQECWQRLQGQVIQARQESPSEEATAPTYAASQYYCQHLLRQCGQDCWERLHSSVRRREGQPEQPPASAFAATEYYCEHLLRQCSRDCWETLHSRIQEGQRQEAQASQSPAEERAMPTVQTDLATTSPRSFYRRHLLPMCGPDCWQRLQGQVIQARQENPSAADTVSTCAASQYYCEHLLRQCGQDCWERLHSSVRRQAEQPQQPSASAFAATEYYCEHLLRQCSRDCWEKLQCRISVRPMQEAQALNSHAGERALPVAQTDLTTTSPRSFYCRHLLPACSRDYWERLDRQFSQASRRTSLPAAVTTPCSSREATTQSYCEQLRQCSQSCWERLQEPAKQATTPVAGYAADKYYREHLLRQCGQDCWERLHSSVRQAGHTQQPVAPLTLAAGMYYRENLLRQCSADFWEKLHCRIQVGDEARARQLPAAEKALETAPTACTASPDRSASSTGPPQPANAEKQLQEAAAATSQAGQDRSATLDVPSQRSWFPWNLVKWRRPRRPKHSSGNEKAQQTGDLTGAGVLESSCAAEDGQDLQLTASTQSGLPGTAVGSSSEPSTHVHEENRSPAASSARLGDSGFLPVVEETPPDAEGAKDGLGSVDAGDRISGSVGAHSTEGRPSSAKLWQRQLRTLNASASQCTIESSTTTVPQDNFPVPETSVEVPSSVDLCASPLPEASELDAPVASTNTVGAAAPASELDAPVAEPTITGAAAAALQIKDDEPATMEVNELEAPVPESTITGGQAVPPQDKDVEPATVKAEPQSSPEPEQEDTSFEVILQWARGATGMGMKFYKPKDPEQPELFIREVQAEGAAMDHNVAVAREGLWDVVLKAEMRVIRVNDVQGSAAAMLEAVREVMQEGQVLLRVDSGVPFARSPSQGLTCPPEKGSWEVMLVADGPSRLGFSATPIREYYGATAPDGLVVTALSPGGLLSRWNEVNPQRKVKRGDFILEINNVRTVEKAQRQLESPVVQMSLVRYSAVFSVLVEKSGLDLGLVFKRSTTTGIHELLVVEVASGGAVSRHNGKSVKGGRWDLAVRPKMCIVGVNGITDDLESMSRSMRACDEVELQVRRTGMFQMGRSGTTHFSRPPDLKKDLEAVQAAAASIQSPKTVVDPALELEASTTAMPAAPITATAAEAGQQARPDGMQARAGQDAIKLPEGATRWEVTLSSSNTEEQRGGPGFRAETWKEAFGAKLGLQHGPEVLVVSEILPTGPLADWNNQRPESSVKVGDLILSVNGERDSAVMQQSLLSAHATLRAELMRHAGHFTVSVDKAGLLMGLSFRRPAVASVHELLIADIDPHGAAAAYNRKQADLGRWELVILPKMCVIAVNGIEGDVDKMLEALRGGQRVDLRLRRAQRPAKAATAGGLAMGAARALKAVRALRVAATPTASPTTPSAKQQGGASPSKTSLTHIDKVLRNAVVEVVLQRPPDAAANWHGLQLVSAQEELGARAGIVGGPHGMIVTQVSVAGLLAKWNASNAGAEVSVGDWMLQVNTRQQPLEVVQEMQEGAELRMNVLRFPKVVEVSVKKGGKEMGLTFKKPKSGNVHELLIVDLATAGAVARHNSVQALSGKWDQVILPRMCIQAVNGIEGDLSKMLEALRACDVAELRIRRSGGQTPQVRPERVASLGLAALRALHQTPGHVVGEEHKAATSAAEAGRRLLPVPAQRH